MKGLTLLVFLTQIIAMVQSFCADIHPHTCRNAWKPYCAKYKLTLEKLCPMTCYGCKIPSQQNQKSWTQAETRGRTRPPSPVQWWIAQTTTTERPVTEQVCQNPLEAPPYKNAFVWAINDFGMNIFRYLRRRRNGSALMMSPVHLSASLQTIGLELDEGTARVIRQTLRVSLSQRSLYNAFTWLLYGLKTGQFYSFSGVYLDKDYNRRSVLLAYTCFSTRFSYDDFIRKKSEIKQKINSHVRQTTSGKVQGVETTIEEYTRLVAVCAQCLDSKWKTNSFWENRATFSSLAGSHHQHQPMWRTIGSFFFHSERDLKVLGIPFENEDFTMFFLLPKNWHQFENALETNFLLDRVQRAWRQQLVADFLIPEFKIDNQSLSMRLDEITDGLQLHYGKKIVNKAVIDVSKFINKVGATAKNRLKASVKFHAKRPFLFLVIHQQTNAIVFLGLYGGRS